MNIENFIRNGAFNSFTDPVTGAELHQLTEGPEPSGHQYFDRCSWTPDGKHFLYVQQFENNINLYAMNEKGERKNLTQLDPTPLEPKVINHMNRQFPAAEIERMMLRIVAYHPSEALIAYAHDNIVHLYHLDEDRDEIIQRFDPEHSMQPATGLHLQFANGGDELVIVTTTHIPGHERVDAPEQKWSDLCPGEEEYISTIWTYDIPKRSMKGEVFRSDGEQKHLLVCPWDDTLMLWLNYLHMCFYTMRTDGTELRAYFDDSVDLIWGHQNWDTANKRVVTLVSQPKKDWSTEIGFFNLEDGEFKPMKSAVQKGQYHPSMTLDGKSIVIDGPYTGDIGGKNGLHLLDVESDTLRPLCQIDCNWSLPDAKGVWLKSEFLHPNPSLSPDGRYVIFGSDFGTGVAQVYAADLESLK